METTQQDGRALSVVPASPTVSVYGVNHRELNSISARRPNKYNRRPIGVVLLRAGLHISPNLRKQALQKVLIFADPSAFFKHVTATVSRFHGACTTNGEKETFVVTPWVGLERICTRRAHDTDNIKSSASGESTTIIAMYVLPRQRVHPQQQPYPWLRANRLIAKQRDQPYVTV